MCLGAASQQKLSSQESMIERTFRNNKQEERIHLFQEMHPGDKVVKELENSDLIKETF